MKILWVKAGGLVPPDLGGRIRSFNILKELARTHDVSIFTFYPEQKNDPHPQLRESFAHVECYPLKIPAAKGLREAVLYARHCFSQLPYTIAKYSQPRVARALRQLLLRRRYDVIICDFAAAGGVFPWDTTVPKVFFTHNVEALIWKRHFQVAKNPFWKAVDWREYRKMARAERLYVNRADLVLTVSEFDREYFLQYSDPSKVVSIPTGVDASYFQPAPGTEDPSRLVFSGSMDWMANEDGITFFIESILPLIRQRVPDASLQIVGRSPSQRLLALAGRVPGVHVTGRVEDIRPYVREGAVYVVPLRVGSGTRLKIFEAMAMGKAIVSTSIGAEGLPVEHDKNIILADEPEEFAAQVVRLLRDPAARSSLGAAGRLLVELEFSWTAVAKQFETALSRAVPEKAAPAARLVG